MPVVVPQAVAPRGGVGDEVLVPLNGVRLLAHRIRELAEHHGPRLAAYDACADKPLTARKSFRAAHAGGEAWTVERLGASLATVTVAKVANHFAGFARDIVNGSRYGGSAQ